MSCWCNMVKNCCTSNAESLPVRAEWEKWAACNFITSPLHPTGWPVSPSSELELDQQFQLKLRQVLITLISYEVYENWKLVRRKRLTVMLLHTEALSETISYKGLMGAAGPAHISISRLATAGICSQGCCKGSRWSGYCTGWKYWGRRNSFAACGIDSYHRN